MHSLSCGPLAHALREAVRAALARRWTSGPGSGSILEGQSFGFPQLGRMINRPRWKPNRETPVQQLTR
eukprot:8892244-Alexandrium_andersonii.AAC.1